LQFPGESVASKWLFRGKQGKLKQHKAQSVRDFPILALH